MKAHLPQQSATVMILASSTLTLATWKLLQWRARKRAKEAADRVQGMIKPGPLIDAMDKALGENIVNRAIRRASKWISFQITNNDGSIMIGQVGGVSVHKRPLLTLEPDYVMKPVQTDHRGIREIVLYEAVKCCRDMNRNSQHMYAALLSGSDSNNQQSSSNKQLQSSSVMQQLSNIVDLWDTLAMWMAMKMNDPIVAENEQVINKSWKALKKEVDTLRRLATFIPSYYGVVGQRSPLSMPLGEEQAHNAEARGKTAAITNGNGNANGEVLPTEHFYGLSLEAHLLLTDMTANFRKPCVMDLKMGTTTYEPDAPEDKKAREAKKYPQQEHFGFRIVGMRFYDPDHPSADENGYRFCNREYGRSLAKTSDVLDALKLFLGAGCVKSPPPPPPPQQEGEGEGEEPQAEMNGQQQQSTARNSGDDETLSKDSSNNASAQQQTLDNKSEHGGDSESNSSHGRNHHNISSTDEEKARAEKELVRVRAISGILANLRPIMGFFDENHILSFHSSSLLIVYEGDREAPNPDATTVKMIDFGRIRRTSGGDKGYKHGLQTFKNMVSKIHRDEKQRLGETTG